MADYHEILRACGTEPVFTLAALARWNACGQPADSFAMLDIGARQSELTIFENAVPTALPHYFLGRQECCPARRTRKWIPWRKTIKGSLAGTRLFISGRGVSKDFAERLAWSLGNGCKCERLEIRARRRRFRGHLRAGEICRAGRRLRHCSSGWNRPAARPRIWRTWTGRPGARALGVLAAAALLLPYAEALLLKPHLERKVAAFKTEAERLNSH